MITNHPSHQSTWTTLVTVALSIALVLAVVLSIGQGLVRAEESPPPSGTASPAAVPILGDWRVAPRAWADQVPAIALGASSYYLVVWDSYRSGPGSGTTGRDIYGLRVQTNGTLWAYPIAICTANGAQHAPDLAYNSSSGHFLVVWYDYRSGLPDIYGQLVDSFGNLIGSEIAICTATGSQYYPRVAYNSDDNEYLVVWQDHRVAGEIYGRRISSTGTLLGSEIVIASGTGSKILPAVDYSITLHRYMVVWGDYRSGNCDIYGRRVQENGTLDPEKAICIAPGDQRHAAVSLNGFNYNWLVVWQDSRNLSTNGYDIYGRLVDYDGDPIGSELVIAAGAQDEDLPRLVYNVNINPPVEREWLVVWHDQNVSPVGGIQARRVYGTGTFDGASFTVSAGDATATAPAVCYDDTWGTNTYLVVWEDYGDSEGGHGEVFGQRVNDDASLEGEPRGISKWTDQSDAALAYNPDDDEYLLVWRDQRGGDYDIWGRRLDGFGNPIDWDFIIGGGSGVQWSPDVAYSSYARRYLVVWTSDYDEVWGQVIEFDGVFLGSNFAICTATGFKWSPAVASSNSDKGFLVAWTDDRNPSSDIYGRRINNNGTLGPSELLICIDSNEQSTPAIAYAPSSGTDTDPYLVVWYDERNGSANRDIYARRVFRTGGLGGEFAVTTDPDHQESPSVGYNSDDDQFLVVWKYRAGSTQDIYGRRVSPSGATVDASFAVCTQADAQWNPAVAYSPVGQMYLVAWEDSRNVVADIYGTRVSRGGAPSGSDFGICTADRSQNYPDLAYGSTQDLFLVTWSDDRIWWRSDDIYARLITGRILPYDTFLPLLFKAYFNPYVSLLAPESMATGVSAAGLFAVVALGFLIAVRKS